MFGHCLAATAIEGLTSRREGARPVSCLLGNDAFRRGAFLGKEPRAPLAVLANGFPAGQQAGRERATAVSRAAGKAMRLATVVLWIFSVRAAVARTAGP